MRASRLRPVTSEFDIIRANTSLPNAPRLSFALILFGIKSQRVFNFESDPERATFFGPADEGKGKVFAPPWDDFIGSDSDDGFESSPANFDAGMVPLDFANALKSPPMAICDSLNVS